MSQTDKAPEGNVSTVDMGKLIQGFIALALVIAGTLAGIDYWRKKQPARTPPAAAGVADKAAAMEERYAPPTPKPADRHDMALDLGDGVRMEFVWIPALNIWVGKYEVTNQEYRRCVPDHRVGEFETHPLNGDRQPVVKVNMGNDVSGYVDWMNSTCLNQLPARYRVRLLTEAETQYILQCGDDRTYPWGSGWPPPETWNYHSEESAGRMPKIRDHRDKWAVSCPVDAAGKNDLGLYGVGDNVQEWNGTKSGTSLKRRTYDLFGASWYFSTEESLRCSHRARLLYGVSTYYIGFRLAIGY